MSVSQHVDLMVSRSGSRPAATVRDLGVMFHAASITSVRDPGSFLRVMMNSPYRPQGAGTQHTRVVYAFKLIRKNAYVRMYSVQMQYVWFKRNGPLSYVDCCKNDYHTVSVY